MILRTPQGLDGSYLRRRTCAQPYSSEPENPIPYVREFSLGILEV